MNQSGTSRHIGTIGIVLVLREMRRWLWCPQWGFCQSDEKTETSLLKKHGELVFCFATTKMWHLKRQIKISNYQQRDCLSTRVATHSQIRIARRMNTLSDACATVFGSEAGRGTHKHTYTQKKNNVKSQSDACVYKHIVKSRQEGILGNLEDVVRPLAPLTQCQSWNLTSPSSGQCAVEELFKASKIQ